MSGDDGAEQATQKDRILSQKEKQMPVLLEVCTLRGEVFLSHKLMKAVICFINSPLYKFRRMEPI